MFNRRQIHRKALTNFQKVTNNCLNVNLSSSSFNQCGSSKANPCIPTDDPWTFYGLSIDIPYPHISMVNLWISLDIHGYSDGYPWIFRWVPIDNPRISMDAYPWKIHGYPFISMHLNWYRNGYARR